jgi:hypothetical protein
LLRVGPALAATLGLGQALLDVAVDSHVPPRPQRAALALSCHAKPRPAPLT